MDTAVPEHRGQPFERLGCFREYDNAADRSVKTVRNADENLSGLSVPLGYERLVGLAYRFVAGLVALHDFSAFLVDNQHVVVLI